MSSKKKSVHIIGGGTVYHVRPHMAISAPAYGGTARALAKFCRAHSDKLAVKIHLTKMAAAGKGHLDTNEDVARLLGALADDLSTKIVIMPVALVDYEGRVAGDGEHGKYGTRLKTRQQKAPVMELTPAEKVIGRIRRQRKDVFLVGFKTTSGATADEMYVAGLH